MVLDSLCLQLSELSKFPVDQVRVLICLVLAYPLSALSRLLPNGNPKHLMSVTIGIYFAYFNLGRDCYHALLSTTVCYLLHLLLPRKPGAYLAILWSFAYVLYVHYDRLMNHYLEWNVDHSGPQMVLVIKCTSLAFNILDGGVDEKELDARQRERRVVKVPSLLEYLGYTFWFGGFLAGPSCEYYDYITFVNGTAFGGKAIPRSWPQALLRLGQGLLCGAGVVVGGSYAVSELSGDWFASQPLLTKWLFYNAALNLSRYKYYLVWYMGEGACTMAGLGYNGVDKSGAARWDKLAAVHFTGVEFGQNLHSLTESWNRNTGVWLKYYIYMRLPESLGFFRLVATHLTSAVWHGLYPGYFMFYICMSFSIEAARRVRRTFRGLFVTYDAEGKERGTLFKPLYDLAGIVAAVSLTNYFCAGFQLLDYGYTLRFWKETYFMYHLGVLAVLVATTLLPPLGSKPPAKPKKTN